MSRYAHTLCVKPAIDVIDKPLIFSDALQKRSTRAY